MATRSTRKARSREQHDPIGRRSMLVLDTNIPRGLIEGNFEFAPLEAFAREGGTVHLADGAMVELIAWFHSDPGAWPKWKQHRARLHSLLHRHEPILMGGREVLARAGIVLLDAPPPTLARKAQQRLNRRIWARFCQVQKLDQSATEMIIPEAGKLVSHQPAGALTQVQSERARWSAIFERYKQAAAADGLSFPGRKLPPELINQRVQSVARHLDRRSKSSPAASLRLDAMLRVHILLSFRSLLEKEPYNPTKKENDAFDHELLRYLALPAALCTDDRRIKNDLNAAGAWQVEWVVRPDDLGDPECRKRLQALMWPCVTQPEGSADVPTTRRLVAERA